MRKNNYLWIGLFLLASFSWADDVPAPKQKFSLQDLLSGGSTTSDQSATVAGVRGLDETSGGNVNTKVRDYAAIDRLVLVVIHEDELKKFVQEGGLQ